MATYKARREASEETTLLPPWFQTSSLQRTLSAAKPPSLGHSAGAALRNQYKVQFENRCSASLLRKPWTRLVESGALGLVPCPALLVPTGCGLEPVISSFHHRQNVDSHNPTGLSQKFN